MQPNDISNRLMSGRTAPLGGMVSACALFLSASVVFGQNSYVNGFGADGWESDDTRNSSGTNIVNGTTHAPAPGSTLDPAQVDAQIDWTNLPGTRGNLGGVSLYGTTSGSGKSSISLMDAGAGLGSTATALGSDFSAAWQWTQTGGGSQGAALKIGIQSEAWGTGTGQSQANGFTATRSGEAAWDLVLVAGTAGTGTTLSTADYDTTVWSVFQQAGNTYFASSGPVATGTLEQIFSGSATMGAGANFTAEEFATMVYGSNAKVTSTQLGIGSGQANGKPVVDYAQVSFLNAGEKIDFVDASLWNNAAGGELSDSGNWDGAAVGPAQNGVFAVAGAYAVTVSGTTAVRSLGVGNGNVTLQVAPGALLQLQNDGYLSAETGASLSVTGGAGSQVTGAAVEAWGSVSLATGMVLDGGSVNHPTRNGRYAIVVAEGGTLDLASGADVSVVNESGAAGVKTLIRVGEATAEGGIATMNIQGGSQLTAGSLFGAGSWTAFHVGDWGGEGQVNHNGGTVDLFGALVIGNEGGIGSYTISGSDSALNIYRPVADNGAIIVGRATNDRTAEGTFNIEGGTVVLGAAGGAPGSVALVVGGLSDNVAGYANAKGTVNQTGGEIRFENGSLKFGRGEGTYNLDGGTLAIGGANGISATLNGNYAFNFGGGTMRVVNSNLSTAIDATLVQGTTSVLDTNGLDATWSGALSGEGTLNKAGAGTLTLSGNNNITGEAYVVGGEIAQTAGTSAIKYLGIGSGPGADGTYTMSGGSLVATQAIQVGDWGGTGLLHQTGGSITVGTVAVGGSFNIGNQGGAGTYNLFGGDFTIVNGLANLGRSTQATAGDGTLNISGTGVFTVGNNGDLIIGDRDPAGGEGAGEVNQSGGILRVQGGGELWLGSVGAGTYNLSGGTLEIGGSALKSNYGSSAGGYAFNWEGGTVKVIGSDLSTAIDVTLAYGTTSTMDTNGLNATWSGVLAGAGTLIKTGEGTLSLIGSNNDLEGEVRIVGGEMAQTMGASTIAYLSIGSGTGSNGAYTATDGDLVASVAIQVGDLGGTGVLNQSGGSISMGTEDFGGTFNIGNQGGTGTFNLSGGDFVLWGGSGNLGHSDVATAGDGTLNLSGGGLFTVGNGANLVVGDSDAAGAEGSGVVNQTGGTLRVLAGSALWLGSAGAGTYNLDGGSLEVGGNALKSDYGGSAGGYAFNLGGGTIKVIGSDLTASLNATLVASSTSTIDTNGFNATWSGTLSGDGSLKKTGTGMVTLSGNSTFTGGTEVAAGTLLVGSASALGSGDVRVGGGATLIVDRGVALDLGTGHSLTLADNGLATYQKNYASGESLADIQAFASGGSAATVAEILNGAASSDLSVTASFNAQSDASNDGLRVSDVLSLDGLDGETFVLQLSYNPALGEEELFRMGWLDGGEWVLAANGAFYEGAYGVVYSGLDVGTYGIDTANNVVWAVLDHNSDFAVIPEPSTYLLLGVGLASVLWGRRRRAGV